jgi:AAA+ ATPase superfamily predicted ATPase
MHHGEHREHGDIQSMDLNQALRIAVKAIDKEIKETNIKANLYEIYKMKSGKAAWEYREKLREARSVLLKQ